MRSLLVSLGASIGASFLAASEPPRKGPRPEKMETVLRRSVDVACAVLDNTQTSRQQRRRAEIVLCRRLAAQGRPPLDWRVVRDQRAAV